MGEQTWTKVYAPRLKAKQWVRNEEVLKNKAALGCWWTYLPVSQSTLQELLQLSSKRPRTEAAPH